MFYPCHGLKVLFVKKILSINGELSNCKLAHITKDKISSTYFKCQKSGFYLGLDKDMKCMKGL
jgi:hypothetical protein